MNFFGESSDDKIPHSQFSPLAERMRPQTLAEFFGQKHLVGEGKLLKQLIDADKLASLIFWGPPGCGKTTLAQIIVQKTKSHFEKFSAVTSGIADVRRVVNEAKIRLQTTGQRTILFIDELHRFNKAQQDAFLPHVEGGSIILIGATTENPSFEVIPPLLSRSRVLVLKELTKDDLSGIIDRGLGDRGKGLGNEELNLTDEARNFLIEIGNGDARVVLNALEIAAQIYPSGSGLQPSSAGYVLANSLPPKAGSSKQSITLDKIINLEVIKQALQKENLRYDKAGEEHYNTISALHKSLRSSDVDASIYYIVRMIEAGEDPLFIARRLVRFASEDIGNADPQALQLAVACFNACHQLGYPECDVILVQTAAYLALAPKSGASYQALNKAREDVQKTLNQPVPLRIRNPVTELMKEVGYGKGYKYSHEINLDNLPDSLKGHRYYFPNEVKP